MSRATVSLFAALTALLGGKYQPAVREPREPFVLNERARDRHRANRATRGARRYWEWLRSGGKP